MIPGRIEGATRNLGAPSNWDPETDGKCASLPIRDADGWMESVWIPELGEIAAIVAGAGVRLRVQGRQHPVVALWSSMQMSAGWTEADTNYAAMPTNEMAAACILLSQQNVSPDFTALMNALAVRLTLAGEHNAALVEYFTAVEDVRQVGRLYSTPEQDDRVVRARAAVNALREPVGQGGSEVRS